MDFWDDVPRIVPVTLSQSPSSGDMPKDLAGMDSLGSSLRYSFTPCAATFAVGPTQLQMTTAYAATTLAGLVTVQGNLGYQGLAVKAGKKYHFCVLGAGGGSYGAYIGLGMCLWADWLCPADQTIIIIVGQQGGPATSYGAGGGGLSGIFLANYTPLIIGGGGGGASTLNTDYAGRNATSSNTGNPGYPGQGNPGAGGALGLGGGFGNYSAGGAGYSAAGANSSYANGGFHIGTGFGGGARYQSEGIGGFGGGGGAYAGGAGGGGAGGGGAGGYSSSAGPGGGGGSYVSPSCMASGIVGNITGPVAYSGRVEISAFAGASANNGSILKQPSIRNIIL